jgi:hypothetical protein
MIMAGIKVGVSVETAKVKEAQKEFEELANKIKSVEGRIAELNIALEETLKKQSMGVPFGSKDLDIARRGIAFFEKRKESLSRSLELKKRELSEDASKMAGSVASGAGKAIGAASESFAKSTGGAVASPSAGGAGNLAVQAVGKGVGGGMKGGILGMLGGPPGAVAGAISVGIGSMIASVAGSIVGKITQSIGAAGEEAVAYNDLVHAMGAATTGFVELRNVVHKSVDGLGVTYEEAVKLADSFTRISGQTNTQELGDSLKTSVGFSRGFGLRPEEGTRFFAGMRLYGQTSDDKENRRLAILIADAISSSKATAKMGEFMQSVQGFVQRTTDQSLTLANTGAFVNLMSSMIGSAIPGLSKNPQNAANLIGNMDATIRRGGGAGEASKLFMLGAFANRYKGFDGLHLPYMLSGGAFGTLSSVFSDDVLKNFNPAERKGLESLRAQDKGETTFDIMKQQFGRDYKKGSREYFLSLAAWAGMDVRSATLLHGVSEREGGLGAFRKFAGKAGIDLEGNMENIGMVAQVYGSDRAGLDKFREKLKGRITEEEQKKLDDASRKGEGEYKTVLAQLANKYGEDNIGKQHLKVTTDLHNKFINFSKELLPAVKGVAAGLEGLLSLLGKIPFLGDKEISEISRESPMDRISNPRGEDYEGPDDAKLKEEYRAQWNKDGTFKGAPVFIKHNMSRSTKSRGLLNNNPGNLKYGPFAISHGAIGQDDKGFAYFPTPEIGSAALDALLENNYSGMSAYEIAEKYLGLKGLTGREREKQILKQGHGNPKALDDYANFIKNRMGVKSIYTPILTDKKDKKRTSQLGQTMTENELGSKHKDFYVSYEKRAAKSGIENNDLHAPADQKAAKEIRERENKLRFGFDPAEVNVNVNGEPQEPVKFIPKILGAPSAIGSGFSFSN